MAHTYTNIGSVRGSCGHRHRTLSGAVRCLGRDSDGCASQGGYSDRHIERSDGETMVDTEYGYITRSEADDIDQQDWDRAHADRG